MAERWSIIVHGGARTIPPKDHDLHRAGCRAAAQIGADILKAGGTALEAVLQSVRVLEDDPLFNAGTGSVPNADGELELDAAVMDGTCLRVGAVAALKGIPNPVTVARLLLDDLPVLLVGEGAQAYAIRNGIFTEPNLRHANAAPAAPQHDTVGCVARDRAGRMAVATSTGGLSGQMAGRVGDAPLAGCGFYVDDMIGGVAISGDGESIIRIALAARVMSGLERQSPIDAARTALAALDRVGGEAGIIALDKDGRFGVAHSSDHFAVAMANHHRSEPRAGVALSDYEDRLNDN